LRGARSDGGLKGIVTIRLRHSEKGIFGTEEILWWKNGKSGKKTGKGGYKALLYTKGKFSMKDQIRKMGENRGTWKEGKKRRNFIP